MADNSQTFIYGDSITAPVGEIITVPAPEKIVQVLPPPTPTTVLLQAYQSGANVDTLTKLLELQERWESREAKKAFDAAFAAFKAEAPSLEKTKEVSYGQGKTAYKYTPLDVINKEVDPLLAKHGLSTNWIQTQEAGNITVTCILKHVQGHAETNSLTGPADTSGSKNPVQSISSGVSYLRRYTKLGVLGMATGDEDTDGVPMGEAADWLTLIKETNSIEELDKQYRAAVSDGLKKQSPKAVTLYMEARKKREKELRG